MLVGADRYLSGRLAERRLGATVHLLDDGFQHLELARDVDLLLVAEDDLHGSAAAGRPAARAARRRGGRRRGAVTAGYDTAAERIGRALGISPVFRVTRTIGAPRMIAGAARLGGRAVGIARVRGGRHRAAGALRRRHLVGRLGDRPARWTFRDHHRFTPRDVRRIAAEAKAAGVGDRADDRKGRRAAGGLRSRRPADRRRCRSSSASSRRTRSATGCSIGIARIRSSQHPQSRNPRPAIAHETPLEYLLVRALIALVRVMPDALVRAGGTLLGLDVLHRRPRAPPDRASATWPTAFPARPAAERRAIARARVRAFRPAAVRAAEVQHAVAASRCWRASSSTAKSASRLAYAQGKGVLFVTGHFGFWELQAMVHALRLEPISVLARALDNPHLNRLLERIRQRTGNTVIYRQGTIRRVMRTLQAGHGVAVLIDQHIMSRDAIYVDFFERPAATTSAVAALALRTGAPVVPVFALPLGGGRYRMIYEHPVEPPRADADRRRPRVHAALHRRARDVRPPASGAVAVDAPPLARQWRGRRQRAGPVPAGRARRRHRAGRIALRSRAAHTVRVFGTKDAET